MPLQKEKLLGFFPPACLLAAWAWFHHQVLFGGNAFVLEDSSRFFFPLWKWGSLVWAQGGIPLWNPDAAFGTPYLADPQMAAWYPPVFLFYRAFNPVTAFNLLIAFHHLFALLGLYLFARHKGYSRPTALAGALVFGFSFNAISLIWASPMLFTFAWIPWNFLAAHGLRSDQKGSFLFLSLTLAMQLAAGYPLFFYLTLLTLLLEWIFEIKSAWNWKRDILLGSGSLALALLYNSAWLLPFREFIPLSNLTQRASFSESLGWGDLASWVNPFLKGHPLYSHPGTPFSVTVYFAGLPLLVLVAWGIATRKARSSTLSLFLLILLLSLGDTGFLGGWLKSLFPGYFLVVRSGYWIPFVIWAALRVFLETENAISFPEEENHRFSAGLWVLFVLLVYGAALAWGVPWDLTAFWISLACLLAAVPGPSFSRLRPVFLTAAILFSLWPAARGMNFTMGRSYYEDPPPVLSQMALPGRLYQSSGWVDSTKTISGQSVSDAYEKLKQKLPPNSPLAWGREEVSFPNSLFLNSFLKWYLWTDHRDAKTSRQFLDYLNVRYEMGNSDSWLENPNCLPKWFSVAKALPFPKNQAVEGALLNPRLNLRKECFVMDESKAGDYHLRSVEELGRGAGRVHLRASGRGRGFLVSSETAYPGWRAKVEGKERPLEVVNLAFRGIRLEEGEEDVQLTYAPTTFRLGCFLSLCVCGIWFGSILRILRGRHA